MSNQLSSQMYFKKLSEQKNTLKYFDISYFFEQ